MFLQFLLIIEGATEKVLQFVVQLSSIYNKKPWFHWTKKCSFEHYREVQTRKSLLMDIIFAVNFFKTTFTELPSIGLC
jgi:hypothetical protein